MKRNNKKETNNGLDDNANLHKISFLFLLLDFFRIYFFLSVFCCAFPSFAIEKENIKSLHGSAWQSTLLCVRFFFHIIYEISFLNILLSLASRYFLVYFPFLLVQQS